MGGGTVKLRIAVIGVWTDAKVNFLFYDLRTRLRVKVRDVCAHWRDIGPQRSRTALQHLATCGALTASVSRSQHFNALSQLQSLLGVKVDANALLLLLLA